MNPMQLIQNYMSKGLNQNQLINMLSGVNPQIKSVMEMAQKSGNPEQFVRNYLNERGINPDEEMAKLKSNFNQR